jgi:hypothetical protein
MKLIIAIPRETCITVVVSNKLSKALLLCVKKQSIRSIPIKIGIIVTSIERVDAQNKRKPLTIKNLQLDI